MAGTLILAEKPAVARDIARVVGAQQNRPGCLTGNGYVVSWAIGHLVTLPEPQEISADWKVWRTSQLPMLPEKWPLKVVENTRDQFRIVERLIGDCDDIICATDAGREGELIFRYIYEAVASGKPVRRLWISSLTPAAIRRGLESLKDGRQYDALADAARARSRADWLVGMNLSRAYALKFGERYFVGRVQTPTLALVVARDAEIRDFRPEDYYEIEATFGVEQETYRGVYLGEEKELGTPLSFFQKAKRLAPRAEISGPVAERVRMSTASVHSTEAKTVRQAPPLLYDLTELQRHANRQFGFSAAATLQTAQSLYEKHKLISYPRTDSAHLSTEVTKELNAVVEAIAGPFRDKLHPRTGQEPLGARYVDDSKVTDHHAILPTTQSAPPSLTPAERQIYDLICRRLLSLWQGDYVTAVTTVLTAAKTAGSPTDLFRTTGTQVVEKGWKILELGGPDGGLAKDRSEPLLPSALAKGKAVSVEEVKPVKKTTRPPPHLNDASLLGAMESAGKNLEDRDLQRVMRDCGLGTPATRAGIIETLLARGYLARQGKNLVSTVLGSRLIETVHPSVKSPELTGRWERELGEIQSGRRTLDSFMRELQDEIRARVQEVLAAPDPAPRTPAPEISRPSAPEPATEGPEIRPERQGDLNSWRDRIFGFGSFRAHQEAVCRSVVEGKDVLLVMPTGAGKSLCYQLPGLVRGGTTLVVSPLVALIDDQVEKLKRLGLAAERIHSGRRREESREVCFRYLEGKLDYLFIAPERLGVPGFPEMLCKRRLSLIAVDEAHCISHWGHDFRPEYRLLGERLGDFRPTPVIALTATATPLVQQDIIKQLGLKSDAVKSIHGFRRTNIAIQLAEIPAKERVEKITSLLAPLERRPAIVYAPTRKLAESTAAALKTRFGAEAYHAGMPAAQRDRVQEAYLRGDLEVIVATIAFGMGIDKPNVRTVVHAALPGSVEGYYQEIGRAGRDGLPSLAVLLHSFADRKTHEFFFEKSYPDALTLKKVFRKLSATPRPKDELRRDLVSLDDDTFDNALEKLWIHKGALVDPEENVALGSENWEKPYAAQREYRLRQLQQMITFADATDCRMLYLISHFGDRNDTGDRCGICDICAPASAGGLVERREASESERRLATQILAAVAKRGGYPVGRLHQDLSLESEGVSRNDFESLISALARQGTLKVTQATFQKEGQTIAYRTLNLAAGATAHAEILYVPKTSPAAAKSKKRRRKSPAKIPTLVPRSAPARPNPVYLDAPAAAHGELLFESLRKWRLAEARKKGIPAFRILSDAVLRGICESQPSNESDLLGVKGLGPALVERYSKAVLAIVNGIDAG